MTEKGEKRIDPKMHSAEHIINQTMVRMFGCARSFSSHLERKKSKLDYHFDRPMEEVEVRELERRVNEIIAGDLPVRERFVSREEAAGAFNLTRLPEDAGDRIRIVAVGDYDACPCIGPHVDSTGAIGAVRVISTSFEDGVLRLRYKLLNA